MMQFMPDTGRQYGLDAAGLRDPARAVPAAGRHLRDLLGQFQDPMLAAAAYNAGPGAVNKYRGVPPYRETRKYVEKARRLMKTLYHG
jgi:soluble lytic murein transglycosylase-like protein